MLGGLRRGAAGVADLALPRECGGCGRPGTPWCAVCARAIRDVPIRLRPSAGIGGRGRGGEVPVWAAGRYRGPLRGAILGLKEHGRRDLAEVLGEALAAGLVTLARWGELPGRPALMLIPAPVRAAAARRRGGDVVTAVAIAAAGRLGPATRTVPLLRTANWVRDSAGLSSAARAANLRGAVTLTRPVPRRAAGRASAVLVDDVLTTGATAAVSCAVLARAGIRVDAVVVLAGA